MLDAVALVMAAAGIGKFLDLPDFKASLSTWALIPERFAPVVAIGVPLLEVTIGAAWLLRLAPRAGVIGSASLLAAFSAVLGLHLLLAQPPECECFGLIQRYYTGRGDARTALIRNGALMTVLFIGVFIRRKPVAMSCHRSPRSSDASLRMGFTLLEVLVCIAVVAALLSLALPALQRSRGEARHSVSMSNLRSHAQVFGAYCADWHDMFPYFTDSKLSKTTLRVETRGIEQPVRYFEAFNFWNWGLADGYYGGDPFQSSFWPPDYWPFHGVADPPPFAWTGYYYGCSFLADPLFWNPSTRTNQSQWRATRADEVTYPSRKGLLVAAYPLEAEFHDKELVDYWADLTATFARCDGSVARVGLGTFLPPMESGDGAWEPPAGYHASWWFPMLHTFDGVRGRDTEP